MATDRSYVWLSVWLLSFRFIQRMCTASITHLVPLGGIWARLIALHGMSFKWLWRCCLRSPGLCHRIVNAAHAHPLLYQCLVHRLWNPTCRPLLAWWRRLTVPVQLQLSVVLVASRRVWRGRSKKSSWSTLVGALDRIGFLICCNWSITSFLSVLCLLRECWWVGQVCP